MVKKRVYQQYLEKNKVAHVLSEARNPHHAGHVTVNGPRCCHEYPVLAS
jgi:hypothetical protein